MKYGFMLIELIIATLIASLVAGILLTALSQSNRSQLIIDNLIEVSERIGIVSNLLEKDLMGAFIPVQADQAAREEEPVADEKDEEKKDQNKKEKKADPQKSAEKKEQKLIEKIFYGTTKEGRLDLLTFITNNPLVVYVGADVGTVKAKVARVQYTLKPEAERKDSYTLFRQEGSQLDVAEYKNVRSYEVISGIKNITVKYVARIEKKEEKKADDQKEQQKVSYEYKELSEWISEQKKENQPKEDGKEKEEFPRIPYHVEFKIALWDSNYKKAKEFRLLYEIPVNFIKPKKEKKPLEPEKKDEKQEQQKQSEQPGKPAQPSQPKVASRRQQPKTQEMVTIDTVQSLTQTLSNLTKLLKQA